MFNCPPAHKQVDPAKQAGQIVNPLMASIGQPNHQVKAPSADFVFANHGSVCVLTPISEIGEEWVDFNIASDAQRWGRGIVIEPRYVYDILAGIANHGLEVV